MSKQIAFIAALALTPAFGSTTYSGTASSGSDTTEFAIMESANPGILFQDITFAGDTGNYSTTGLTDATTGVSFTGVDNSGPDLHGVSSFGTWGQTPVIDVNNGNGNITATLPANVYAVAFDLLALGGGVVNFDVTINNGSTTDLGTFSDSILPGSGFFGYVSTTPITSVVISGSTSNPWAVDNFEVGTESGSQTPEVATMIIIGLGLCLIRGLRRWLPANQA